LNPYHQAPCGVRIAVVAQASAIPTREPGMRGPAAGVVARRPRHALPEEEEKA